jgi:hypothetical protein
VLGIWPTQVWKWHEAAKTAEKRCINAPRPVQNSSRAQGGAVPCPFLRVPKVFIADK